MNTARPLFDPSTTPTTAGAPDLELIKRLTDRTASDPVLRAQVEALQKQVEQMQSEKAKAEREKADAEVKALREFRDKARRLATDKNLSDEEHSALMADVFREVGYSEAEIENLMQNQDTSAAPAAPASPAGPRGGDDPARRLFLERMEADWKAQIKKGVTENPVLQRVMEAHKKKGLKPEDVEKRLNSIVNEVYEDASRIVREAIDKGGKVSYDLLNAGAAQAVSGFAEKAQWWAPGGEGMTSASESDPAERLRALAKQEAKKAPRFDAEKQSLDPTAIDREFEEYAMDALVREVVGATSPSAPGSSA